MAYSRVEQAYIDGVADYQFPDPVIEEPAQEQPMMLAESGQVKSDAQPGFGTIGPIPRNKAQEALGYVGELLTKAGVQLDKVGLDIPILGRITLKDLTVGESGRVLEDMSYGFMPVEGAGGFISGTTRIKPDEALELLNIAPVVGAAAKVGGKAVTKGITQAVEATKGLPVGMSVKPVGQGVDELGFYSAATKAVDGIQQPKGTGAQFLAQIEKTPGVKPEEIKWTGLDDFLKSKKTVTKQEVQEYLAANRVEIKEVKLGEQQTYDPVRLKQLEEEYAALKQHPIDDPSFGEDKYDEMIRLMNIRDRSTTDSLYASMESATRAAQRAQAKGMPEAAERYFRQAELFNTRAEKLDLEGLGMDAPTKFEKYTLPGGENYREVLLTLPPKQTSASKIEFKTSEDVDNFLTDMSISGYENLNYGRLNDGNVVEFDGAIPSNVMQMIRNNDGDIVAGKATAGSTYGSPHFEQQNILAHLRVNDRVDADGKKVLFVEEVQSDWHQAGRKKGYQGSMPLEQAKQKLLNDGYTPEALANSSDADIIKIATEYGVPDAPFKANWHELALKRAIQMAAEGGYDRIAFTTGAQQAARYDLSKQVKMISAMPDKNGKYNIYIEGKDGDPVFRNTNGFSEYGQKTVTPEEFEELVGKDAAKTIMQKADELNRGKVSKDQFKFYDSRPEDLTIGGEGMKGFYDNIVPKFLDKYGKKWDAKTGMTKIRVATDKQAAEDANLLNELGVSKDGPNAMANVHYIDITPKMKKSVLTQGQPLFAIGAGGAGAAMQQEEKK